MPNGEKAKEAQYMKLAREKVEYISRKIGEASFYTTSVFSTKKQTRAAETALLELAADSPVGIPPVGISPLAKIIMQEKILTAIQKDLMTERRVTKSTFAKDVDEMLAEVQAVKALCLRKLKSEFKDEPQKIARAQEEAEVEADGAIKKLQDSDDDLREKRHLSGTAKTMDKIQRKYDKILQDARDSMEQEVADRKQKAETLAAQAPLASSEQSEQDVTQKQPSVAQPQKLPAAQLLANYMRIGRGTVKENSINIKQKASSFTPSFGHFSTKKQTRTAETVLLKVAANLPTSISPLAKIIMQEKILQAIQRDLMAERRVNPWAKSTLAKEVNAMLTDAKEAKELLLRVLEKDDGVDTKKIAEMWETAEAEAIRELKSLARPEDPRELPHPLDTGTTMDKVTQSKYDKILADAIDPKEYRARRKPGT